MTGAKPVPLGQYDEAAAADALAAAEELPWVYPDSCPLPELAKLDDNGEVMVRKPGETWSCQHGLTWTVVPVGIRGGLPQPAWIIRPPVDPPPTPPTT